MLRTFRLWPFKGQKRSVLGKMGLLVGSEISDPWANLGKSISLQILIEGLTARCFQQNSTIGSLGKSWNNGKTGF